MNRISKSGRKDCVRPPLFIVRHSTSTLFERFLTRGQHPCKFIGTKESVYIGMEFNFRRIGLVHQHGRCFIVLGHQKAVTCVAGRRKGGRKVKMSAGGKR